MTQRGRFTITIAGLALLLAALPASAHPPGRGPHGPGDGFMESPRLERLAERLDLGDGQLEELQELFAARFEEGADARLDLFRARRALSAQIHAQSLDEAAIREAAAAVAALEADAAVARARQAQNVRQILTPEQQAELDAMRAERQRFGGPRGRRGPGGRGFGGPPPVAGE